MINFSGVPFHLTPTDTAWVQDTLSGMSLHDKVGQIFCLVNSQQDAAGLSALIQEARPGAIMHRAGDSAAIQEASRVTQEASSIPLLIAANLESGGNGICDQGTYFAKPLQVAATGDALHAKRLGRVAAIEGAALGCNWSFAPVADIDFNWRNPITNVRTFGGHPDTVADFCVAYLEGTKEAKVPMAVCPKHFPGDGVDERDHHLLASVNHLDEQQWEESYGKVYRRMIREGAHSIMAGHILAPALERVINPDMNEEEMLPASQSHGLLTGYLRGRLGFQGVIVTDATPMVGFQTHLPRAKALRAALMAGADMLLFTKNRKEDYAAIMDGLKDGSLTKERLDEAVSRVLAMKASLKLHTLKQAGKLVPAKDALRLIGSAEHQGWSKECAEQGITLVRDKEGLLPLCPDKTKRVRLVVLGEDGNGSFGDNALIGDQLAASLREQGFEVLPYDSASLERGEIFISGINDLKNKFDLCLIAANVATGSNLTTRRVDWISLMAANAPWFVRDIPTVFVSFANPYHLFDVPYIGTFINAYSNNSATVDACVSMLRGLHPFHGKSPVHPCF